MRIDFVEKPKEKGYVSKRYDIFIDGVLVGKAEEHRGNYYACGLRGTDADYFSFSGDNFAKIKKDLIKYFEGKEIKPAKKTEVKYLPTEDSEFYPTPKKLCGEMIGLVDWAKVKTMLEPSAGKGDIIDSVKGYFHSKDKWSEMRVDVDCVELDENLRYILKGKKYRVVHDDFMSYETDKRYDLIMMNPPFSVGARHLLKAISMQENGGQIVCILNAKTVRNPYSNERKALLQKIEKYGAKVKYLKGAFGESERRTDVEIAIVYINIPDNNSESEIFEKMKKAQEQRYEAQGINEVAPNNSVEFLLRSYELESAVGVEFLKEYNRISPRLVDDEPYKDSMIRVCVGKNEYSHIDSQTVNEYLKLLRLKYWRKLFDTPKLKNMMTSKIAEDYDSKIAEMKDYEFSDYNIKQVFLDINEQLLNGVDDEMDKLFDKLSCEHSYWDDCKNNIHYYNGWKTNKAHKVNYKVIIPCNGYGTTYVIKNGRYKDVYEDHIKSYKCYSTLADIEMTLSYLEGNGTCAYGTHGLSARLDRAERDYETKNIDCRYFSLAFYKKGTCHITFNEDAKVLVDRLNNYVGSKRGWLPPCYGKKSYKNMTEEERETVVSYNGSAEEYEKVYENPSKYIIQKEEILRIAE